VKRSITVSEITKEMRRHSRKFGESMTKEMSLQSFPKNSQWRRRRDVLRQSVPQSGSSDRKSSIADGWKTGASSEKRWWRYKVR